MIFIVLEAGIEQYRVQNTLQLYCRIPIFGVRNIYISFLKKYEIYYWFRCVHSSLEYQAYPWWRHQMETFSALLALCEGNSPVTGEFPSQKPVSRSFDVFFDLHLNKRLNKQPRRRWFETPLCSLWRHCNASHTTSTGSAYDIAVSMLIIHLQYVQTTLQNNANFVVTGGTAGCRYDNLRCHQGRQSWHHDDSWVLAYSPAWKVPYIIITYKHPRDPCFVFNMLNTTKCEPKRFIVCIYSPSRL